MTFIDITDRRRMRQIGAAFADRVCTRRPKPAWWIHYGYTGVRVADRTTDDIHRSHRCAQSYLNVPWPLPARVGVAVALDQVRIVAHLRLCPSCFTRTETDRMDSLAYYVTPARSHADRMAHARALAKSTAVPGVAGNPDNALVLLDCAEALMIRPGVALMHITLKDGEPPEPDAHLINALGRRSPHRIRGPITGTNEHGVLYARVTIVRADDPDYEATVEWTTDTAAQAGLMSEPHWLNNPLVQLKRRVVVEAIRDNLPEVLMGMDRTPDAPVEQPATAEAPSQFGIWGSAPDDTDPSRAADLIEQIWKAGADIGLDMAAVQAEYRETFGGALPLSSVSQLEGFLELLEGRKIGAAL